MNSIIRQTAIVTRPAVHVVAARPQAQVTSVRSVVALPSSGATTEPTQQILTVEVDGQTVFTLPSTPKKPHLSELHLNGVKATYGTGYVINTSILTWFGVTLTNTDTLEINYR